METCCLFTLSKGGALSSQYYLRRRKPVDREEKSKCKGGNDLADALEHYNRTVSNLLWTQPLDKSWPEHSSVSVKMWPPHGTTVLNVLPFGVHSHLPFGVLSHLPFEVLSHLPMGTVPLWRNHFSISVVLLCIQTLTHRVRTCPYQPINSDVPDSSQKPMRFVLYKLVLYTSQKPQTENAPK